MVPESAGISAAIAARTLSHRFSGGAGALYGEPQRWNREQHEEVEQEHHEERRAEAFEELHPASSQERPPSGPTRTADFPSSRRTRSQPAIS